jgi:hypothetical protein
MSYTRHLDGIFRRAGVDKTPENRNALDRIIRQELGMERNDEADVWPLVREKILQHKDPRLEERVVKALARHVLVSG